MNSEPRSATLTKAIDVLTALLGGPRSLAVISKQTKLPKPTVHRLLDGLAYKDLVIQVDEEGTYTLGPGCLRLAEAATQDGGGLTGVAWPILETLDGNRRDGEPSCAGRHAASMYHRAHQFGHLALRLGCRVVRPSHRGIGGEGAVGLSSAK